MAKEEAIRANEEADNEIIRLKKLLLEKSN